MERKQVLLVNKASGEIVRRFKSVNDAAVNLGKSYSLVYHACQDKTLGKGMAVLRFDADYDPREDFGEGSARPVVAYLDGVPKHVFPNMCEASRSLGYEASAARYHVSNGSCTRDGWSFKRMRFMGDF